MAGTKETHESQCKSGFGKQRARSDPEAAAEIRDLRQLIFQPPLFTDSITFIS
jgi:hypothetical protein